jgi:CheY-like chemotaxis protein
MPPARGSTPSPRSYLPWLLFKLVSFSESKSSSVDAGVNGVSGDVAANSLEVLQVLHRQPYDVVLMDVQMPVMDGLATTHCIHQEWTESQRPRIIAMPQMH